MMIYRNKIRPDSQIDQGLKAAVDYSKFSKVHHLTITSRNKKGK